MRLPLAGETIDQNLFLKLIDRYKDKRFWSVWTTRWRAMERQREQQNLAPSETLCFAPFNGPIIDAAVIPVGQLTYDPIRPMMTLKYDASGRFLGKEQPHPGWRKIFQVLSASGWVTIPPEDPFYHTVFYGRKVI